MLNDIGTFTNEESELVRSLCVERKIKKKETLLVEGQICQSIYLLNSGAFYQFQLEDIDQQIVDLHLPGDWFLNQQSFISQKPSTSTIVAFQPSEVLELRLDIIHSLINRSPTFFQLGKLMEQSSLQLAFANQSLSPSERYDLFLKINPKAVQVFPLKMIASFLKMTPETLSRVRAASR